MAAPCVQGFLSQCLLLQQAEAKRGKREEGGTARDEKKGEGREGEYPKP